MSLFRHREHNVPGLNTTSTADISFMLLIFFLVTTNMDVDKGLQRQLPPASKQEAEESYAAEGTVLALRITADNKLTANGKPVRLTELREKVETFVEKTGKRHLITIDVAREADYDTYFHLQNELVAAYRCLWDKTARRLYGRRYAQLAQEQRDAVRDACPQRVAEQYTAAQAQEKGGGL